MVQNAQEKQQWGVPLLHCIWTIHNWIHNLQWEVAQMTLSAHQNHTYWKEQQHITKQMH